MKFDKNLLTVVSLITVISLSGCIGQFGSFTKANKFIGTWELKSSLLGEEVSIGKITFSETTAVIVGMVGTGSATYELVDDTYLLMTDNESGESNKWYYEFVNDNTVMFWDEDGRKTVWQRVG